MLGVLCLSGLRFFLTVCLLFTLEHNMVNGDTVVNMRKVTHQRVQEPLSGSALLPCVFTLRPSPSHEPPRIKWTRLWGQRGADGLQKQQSILVAKDNIIKVKKAFQGRVTLPGYSENRYNASLLLTGLRSSDSGMYRCEVVVGINDEQDTVPLQRVCVENSANIATPAQLQATFDDGYDNCDAGWLSDQTVRYPIQSPRPGCYGDREDSPGIRNYGSRAPEEMFDVYCFANSFEGEVFHSSVSEKLSLASASIHCHTLGAQLANVGQLYLAWQGGLDRCDPGWLADGSVRYPINLPRRNCGGDEPGVRTVYHNPNRTGFPETSDLFDAYCYRENLKEQAAKLQNTIEYSSLNASSDEEVQLQRNTSFPQPSTWTGLVDLETEDFRSIINNESSEISEEHVVIHMGPEEKSVDLENLPGGSAKEENDPDPDPSSTTPSSSTQAQTSNSVISTIVHTIMKPFRYLTGKIEPEGLSKDTTTRMMPSKGDENNVIMEQNTEEHLYQPSTSGPEEELLEQEKEVVMVAKQQEKKSSHLDNQYPETFTDSYNEPSKEVTAPTSVNPTLSSMQKSFIQIKGSHPNSEVPPSSDRLFATQTSTPEEVKRGGLEIMSIPRNIPENFSGDLNEDGFSIPKDPQSSENEKGAEGSGGRDLSFILDSQTKGSNVDGVPRATTEKQQLLGLQHTEVSSPLEPKQVELDSPVEEARGEIMYIQRPIEKPKINASNKVTMPFVKRKQDAELTLTTTKSLVNPTDDDQTIKLAESRSGESESFVLARGWTTPKQVPGEDTSPQIPLERDVMNSSVARPENMASRI
ncbi:hypothetical protein DNTS_031666, partial [Danionella cerebrum]